MKALEQQLAEAESAATDKENAHAKALQDKAEEHARVVEEQTLAHASSMEEQAQALQEGQTRTQTLQEELDALRAQANSNSGVGPEVGKLQAKLVAEGVRPLEKVPERPHGFN